MPAAFFQISWLRACFFDGFNFPEVWSLSDKKYSSTENDEFAKHLLNEFKIYDRREDYLKGYSSGMLQRMKFIFALLHSPKILFLDEPTSNLDAIGKDKVYEIIEQEGKDKLVIIASNEDSDLELCSEVLEIEKFKN